MRVLPHLVAATLAALLVAQICAIAALAQEHECALAVEPASGVVGTEFVLRGDGYSPVEMTLQKEGADPVTVPLDLPDGPFRIPVASGPGDEGRWTATVNDPDAGCSATVAFRVTLLDTAAEDLGHAGGTRLPLGVYLLVVAAGVTAGAGLAKYRRAA